MLVFPVMIKQLTKLITATDASGYIFYKDYLHNGRDKYYCAYARSEMSQILYSVDTNGKPRVTERENYYFASIVNLLETLMIYFMLSRFESS